MNATPRPAGTSNRVVCSQSSAASQHADVGARMEGQEFAEAGRSFERDEETKNIRRLQLMISMVSSVISQDPDLTVEEAAGMVANARRAALAMFPGKELAFDILYKPRLQRLMRERFRIQ